MRESVDMGECIRMLLGIFMIASCPANVRRIGLTGKLTVGPASYIP